MTPLAIWWCTWRERKGLIFEGKACSIWISNSTFSESSVVGVMFLIVEFLEFVYYVDDTMHG